MSRQHAEPRKKVRITAWGDPLDFWEAFLTDAEIRAYQLAGYIVAEVSQ